MRIICHGLKDNDYIVDFTDHRVSMGLDTTNEIMIQAVGVSRQHAIILEIGQNLYIQDYNSLNGTFLNRERVKDQHVLASGDIIQVGIQQIRVELFPDLEEAHFYFIDHILEDNNSMEETAVTVLANAKLQEMIREESAKTVADEKTINQVTLSTTTDLFIEGREVGNYIVERLIGKGGMGEIYLAKHKTLGTYRAIKVLAQGRHEDNTKFFDRFIREARLAAEIKHSNVIEVIDVDTDESLGFPYIVMEYIDGGSLRRILKSINHLSEEQAVVIIEAIAAALQVAEQRNIVHRDIKPDNIMFTKQGGIKLADLGIAKNDDEESTLTKTNVMIGTPAYLSPEQVQNAKMVDIRADIYSLGATFYEMLTGQHPYPGQSTYEILHKLFADPVPDPRKINPDISDASAEIIMKMLAKDADDRFQTPTELLETLHNTFPAHTDLETAELIKKAISGICEDDPTFRSEITKTNFTKKIKGRKKSGWAAVLVILMLLLIAGVAVYRLYPEILQFWPFHEPSKPYQVNTLPKESGPDSPESQPSPPLKDPKSISETKPVAEVVPEEKYDLSIKTSPDALIRIKYSSGEISTYYADGKGERTIPQLKKGTYEVEVSKDKHITVSRSINLNGKQTMYLTLSKDHKALTVHALPNSVVSVFGDENKSVMLIVPENGIVKIPELLPEKITVRAELTGYRTSSQEISLRSNQDVYMQQAKIKNTLTIISSVPAISVELKLNGETKYAGNGDFLGQCTIHDVDYGVYDLFVSCEGYNPHKQSCDMTRNQTLSIPLKHISYDIEVVSNPGARFIVLKDNQQRGSYYYIPSNGKMKIPSLEPGSYSILVEKEGYQTETFDFALSSENLTVSCMLTAKIESRTAGSDSGGNPQEPVSAPPKEETGELVLQINGNTEAINFGLKNLTEVKIGSEEWVRVKELPYRRTELKPGRYTVSLKMDGMQPMSSKNAVISVGKRTQVVFTPRLHPVTLSIDCSIPGAEYRINDSDWDECGNSVILEPLTAISVSVRAKGYKTIKRTYTPPMSNDVVYLPVSLEKEKPKPNAYRSEGLRAVKEGNYREAVQPFILAVEQGDIESMYQLGQIYENGLGISSPKIKDAFTLYKDAAVKGQHRDAAYCAGVLMMNESTIPVDNDLILQFFQTAADQGHPEAQYLLGQIYEKGDYGSKQNLQTAQKYYTLAANQGHAESMFCLAELLMQQNNVFDAKEWYEKAAQKGHSKAANQLDLLKNI